MPTSYLNNIPTIIGAVKSQSPKSILDVGCGFGKYGFLIREYLELWTAEHRYNKSDWKIHLDALEPFEQYITEAHQYIYDTIYNYTVQQFIDENSNTHYDTILMIDVLEHFPKDEGMKIINNLKNISDNILVSIPIVVSKQGAAFGNSLETHYDTWEQDELKSIGAYKFFTSNNSWICLIR